METFALNKPHENFRINQTALHHPITPRNLSIFHGAFYIASGLWPLISMKTFEKVTGPKKEDWLVKTVGLLIAASGGLLLRSGLQRMASKELAANSAAQAFVLGSVSTVYSLKGRISKIYLLDAIAEYSLVALWYFVFRSKRGRSLKTAK